MSSFRLLTVVVLALALSMLLGTPDIHAQSNITWTDYGKVFDPGRAYYPTVLYDANLFSGHGDSHYYKMWYSTGNGIALAYSDDGKSWTLYNSGIELSTLTNAHHNRVIFDVGGFGGSGIYYKMWYWNDASEYTDPIRYAESTDGILWTSDQPIIQDPSSPLVTGWVSPYWFYSSYGPSSIFYTASGYATINDADPMGNRYVMYYDAASQGYAPDGTVEGTALAYSADGISWKRYGSEPVLKASGGISGAWDSGYAYAWTVMKWSGLYAMWYSGGTTSSDQGIGYAESVDGLSWTKYASNPIETVGGPGSWNEIRDYTPMVIYDANRFGGHGDSCDVKMYYSGRSAAGVYAIGYKCGLGSQQFEKTVGGAVIPVSTPAILAPWLVVIGLVGCIATAAVVAKRRRR